MTVLISAKTGSDSPIDALVGISCSAVFPDADPIFTGAGTTFIVLTLANQDRWICRFLYCLFRDGGLS